MSWVCLARQWPGFQNGGMQTRCWASGGQDVCVFVCLCGCVSGRGGSRRGRWMLVQFAGGSGPLAGGYWENKIKGRDYGLERKLRITCLLFLSTADRKEAKSLTPKHLFIGVGNIFPPMGMLKRHLCPTFQSRKWQGRS